MKALWFALLAVLATTVPVRASTEVRMLGDARIHGTFFQRQNFTGWNAAGTRTADTFAVWERIRLHTDIHAAEALSFRFSVRANNIAWGNNTFTVDNPAVAIQVWQSYLKFKWPGTDLELTVGLQDWSLPVSSPEHFFANPVFGGTRSAAALAKARLTGQVQVLAGFTRFLDSNRDFDPTTTQVADELDGWLLALPISVEGFKATPWAFLAVAGRSADYAGTFVGTTNSTATQTLAGNMLSAGTAQPPAGLKNDRNPYWWAGAALSASALEDFRFHADFMYGQGAAGDRGKSRRGGLFLDAGVEYLGFNTLTPQAAFWYATGEDASTGNGSERMPVVVGYWGPSGSFLFDSSQAFTRSVMGVNPVGAWGVAVSLNKVSFVKDLTHRLTVTWATGNNAPRALRQAVALWGQGAYVQMGRDLARGESAWAVNFDHQYDIYENLAAVVEAGWAHGEFKASVWGRRMAGQARSGDPVKVAAGLRYRF